MDYKDACLQNKDKKDSVCFDIPDTYAIFAL